jgi:hypothetical protein
MFTLRYYNALIADTDKALDLQRLLLKDETDPLWRQRWLDRINELLDQRIERMFMRDIAE